MADFSQRAEDWLKARTHDVKLRALEEKLGAVSLPDCPYILTVFVGLYGRLFQVFLERHGYTVRFAFTADEIIAKMKLARPIFLICYVGAASVDGFNLIQAIRSTQKFSDLPVLAVVPDGQQHLASEAQNSGATKVLIAPFAPIVAVEFANSIYQHSP